MQLILWRHADAEDADGKPDFDRRLTKKGRKQAERMAEWLRPRLSREWRILASPAVRALETVESLAMDFDKSDDVGLAATPHSVLRAAGWPHGKMSVVVVGHQPTLGQVAAMLLEGSEGDVAMKKGAIWWFATRERDGELQTLLQAVTNPDELE
ncbi:MAG: phosphohistidine phosphatase SixA [Bacillota bacterium]